MQRVALRQLVIHRDNREKKGHALLFPPNLEYWLGGRPYVVKVKVDDTTLPAGDYGSPGSTLGFEKKASVRELHTNLFTVDRTRAMKAFRKFADAFERPVLLLHIGVGDFLKTHTFRQWVGGRTIQVKISGPRVFNEMARVGDELGFSWWMVGPCKTVQARRALGNLVARRFLVDSLVRGFYYSTDLKKAEE